MNLIRNILFLNCECRDAKGFLSLMLCFIRMNSFLTISNFISCTKGIMSLCYKLGFSNPYIFPTQFVYLTYFKLWILLDQVILARNVKFLHHQVVKKIQIRKFEFEAKAQFLYFWEMYYFYIFKMFKTQIKTKLFHWHENIFM